MRHKESSFQSSCVTWFRLQYPEIGRLLCAIPNGGARGKTEAKILKGEGVTAGVADCVLFLPRGGYGTLCIEFKTDTGRQSPAQKDWQQLAERYGNKYVICRSFEEFRETIISYIGGMRI